MTYDSPIRPPSGRMSPAAVALAVAVHALVAAALWWISPLRPHDQSETPIMVTVEPEPLSGGGAPAAGGGAPTAEPAAVNDQLRNEPTQQALAPAEPAPPQPQPLTTPQLQPQPTEPTPPTEALWQTEPSDWKPQVTFEQSLPPPETPPPPTSHDIPKPQRPPPPAARPVQRAQTALPPRPVQAPAPRQAGDQQAAASVPGPSNSSMDASSGHGGQRNDYLSRVFRHIEPFRDYPALARANRQQGRVVSRVTINRQGQILDATVDRSSGWPAIDAAELAAIRKAGPLPPVPASMPGDPLVLILPVTYRLP